MTDSDGAGPVFGELIEITPDGVARGWCFSQADLASRRVIAVVAQGRILATAVCNEPNAMLQEAGFGDGAYGFSAPIAMETLPRPDTGIEIAIEDLESGEIVGEPLHVAFDPPPLPAAPTLRAMLDAAAADGWITGWCWDEAAPSRRVRVTILVDNEPVGATTADIYRADLATAGIGDGAHAFSYLLPWEAIAAKSAVEITLKDADLGRMLPASAVFRRPEIASIEDRLRALERQLRLAASRADDMQRRAAQDAERLSGIFRTIGVFFQRLAETEHGAIPTALVPSLADLLEGVSARRPALTLDVPRDPLMTLCVDADGTVDGVYDCLAALHAASVDRLAEIVLVDHGRSEAAALIAAAVQNLRIWRVPPGQSVPRARNQLVLWAGRDYAGFVSSAARLDGAWVRSVLETFEREPACGAICAKLVREDGLIAGSGLLPGPRGEPVDFAEAEPADLPRCDHRRPVLAATDRALIVRGQAFAAVDGFDAAFVDGADATIDLCLRLWDAGAGVFYQPVGHVGWVPSAMAGVAPAGRTPVALPAARWATALQAVGPAGLGRALVLHGESDASDVRHEIGLCAGLIEAGLAVAFAWPDLSFPPGAITDQLRAIGVEVWRADHDPSVAAALRNAAEPIRFIFADRGAVRILSPQMLRGVAPDAALILLCADATVLDAEPDLAEWATEADRIWLPAAAAGASGPLAAKTALVLEVRADPQTHLTSSDEKALAVAFGATLRLALAGGQGRRSGG